jgi:hypothetical protein
MERGCNAKAPSAPLEPLDLPENRSWRLFQLAFLILNLPSLTKLDHPERCHETNAVADLLRFVLIHSLSHMPMRQISLECGYAAASDNWSIRSERKRGFFKLLSDMTGAEKP